MANNDAQNDPQAQGISDKASNGPSVRRYGWRPSLPDQRDRVLKFAPQNYEALAQISSVDLSDKMPPVYDQGDLGSCTANAVCAVLHYDEIKQGKADQNPPSRLFEYWNTRYVDPYAYTNEDSGSTITSAIKAASIYGFVAESLWPYDVKKFAVEAPSSVYTAAVQGRIRNYARVRQTVPDIQLALVNGDPVAFGFTVYSSFETAAVAKTGTVPMPHFYERAQGGHAVVCVGFDNATQRFKVRNSWGADWGNFGYFTMPYAYLTNENLSDDFWVINAIP